MELFTQTIQEERDILSARDRARVTCEELGFDITQQLQVTTAVFELGKNILEYGKGGTISFALLAEGDLFSLEIEGTDEGPGISEEKLNEVLEAASGAAIRGIPAMKRMMDHIEVDSEPGAGTTIRLVKNKSQSPKSLAGNFVGFLQEKFSTRDHPTISDELRLQNTNLVQTLSLYEEKNEELERKNRELLDLKQQLENSNAELHDRTAELQDVILSLGDRTTELEAQNRRFNTVLQEFPCGLAITTRSGIVLKVNERFCAIFDFQEEDVSDISKTKWYDLIGTASTMSKEEWKANVAALNKETKKPAAFPMKGKISKKIQCRVVPILDEDKKFQGRLWIFE